jgi:hypothetical protein
VVNLGSTTESEPRLGPLLSVNRDRSWLTTKPKSFPDLEIVRITDGEIGVAGSVLIVLLMRYSGLAIIGALTEPEQIALPTTPQVPDEGASN